MLSIQQQNEWLPLYRFDLNPQYPADFEVANYYVSNWPTSHFRHHLMMCLKGDNGVSLTQNDWQFSDGQPRTQDNAAELYQLIQQRFGLRVDDKQHGFSLDEFAAICRF